MKRVLLAGFFLLPTVAGAQLSSENFQIDGLSVGNDASIRASSSNFSVTQETGGLFEVTDDENAEVDGSTVLGGYINDEDGVETTENNESSDDGSAVLSERPVPEVEVDTGVVATGDRDASSTEARSSDEEVVEGNVDEATASTTPRSISRFVVETAVQSYLWIWWLLPLLLIIYIVRRSRR